MKLLSVFVSLWLFFAVPFQKEKPMPISMEQVHASFRADVFGGLFEERACVLRSQEDFSKFLSDPVLFFDGRFAFYEQYETGDFFSACDLLALACAGERELVSCVQRENTWEVTLRGETKGRPRLYLVTVPKSGILGVKVHTV